MARLWYAYTGNGDDTDPFNYIRITWDVEFTCLGGSLTCAIYSPPNPRIQSFPTDLSDNIKNYLVAGKALFDKYPNDGINKPYIYTRPMI